MILTVSAASAYWGLVLIPNSNLIADGPVADFTFDPSDICGNEPVSFINTSTGEEEMTYSWGFGDGVSSAQKDPVHRFPLVRGTGTRTFQVTLTVTMGEATSTKTQSVTVKNVPDLTVTSDQEKITFEGKTYFLLCENEGTLFKFYNSSATKNSNVKYTIDWGDGTPIFEGTSWESLEHPFDLGITTITYTVEGPSCTFTETFNVFVGLNPAVGLGNPGNTSVCSGESLTFPITGTALNPPGTVYVVTFSDGTPPVTFTHPPPAEVTHIFDISSCGFRTNDTNNAFSASIVARNPCASSFASINPIYVSKLPNPVLSIPPDPVCVNEVVSIQNLSVYGTEVSSNGTCSDGKYVWEISPSTGWELVSGSLGVMGNPELPNSWNSGSFNIRPRFTEPGIYTIKLTNGGRCGIAATTETICVIPRPQPAFELDVTEACGPVTVKATNTSNFIEACERRYSKWSVTYQSGTCGTTGDWAFTGGTNEDADHPELLLTNPGLYTILLTYTTSCGVFQENKTVLVTAPPIVTLRGINDLCGPGSISPTAEVTNCTSDVPLYRWTFEGGIPATSEEAVPGAVRFETPGTKRITLEVTNSCGPTLVEQVIQVYDLPQISLATGVEICQGESYEIVPDILPAAGNFSFLWTGTPAVPIANPTARNISVSPGQTTTFKLKVTDRDTDCFVEEEILIVVTPAPVISFDIPDQTICSGETTLPVLISTNTEGATTAWSVEANGVTGTIASGTSDIPVQTLINDSAQPIQVRYTALITSAAQGSCDFVPLVHTVTVLPLVQIDDQIMEICNGETANFTFPETFFQWRITDAGGVGGATANQGDFAPFLQTLSNTGTSPLTITYELTPVRDGCVSDVFTIAVRVLPSPNINFSLPSQTICSGNANEEILLSSDVPGVNFTWEVVANGVAGLPPSGAGNVIPSFTMTNPTVSPLEVVFKVFAVSAQGTTCSGIPQQHRILVNPGLGIEVAVKDYSGFGISCHGADDGEIRVSLSGGSGTYSLQWTGPDGFRLEALELIGLKPGIYSLTVEDDFECDLVRSFEISEPLPLSISLVSKTDVICAGQSTGRISVAVNGGVDNRPYIYTWTRNGQNTPYNSAILSEIPAGNYAVQVSDANGCTVAIESIVLTEPEEVLLLSVEKRDISCYNANDGFINLSLSGGVPPYVINWNFGSSMRRFDNMGPGTYTVTVRDQLGCEIIRPITIVDAPVFRVNPVVKQISCFGERDASIILNFEGGRGRVTFRWDDGAEVENRFNLTAGLYGVTVIDEDGCRIRRDFIIVEPSLLVAESFVQDALDCNNPQSGEIALNISGGSPPYTFLWSNGQTTQSLSAVTAGQYAVEISDANGCKLQRQFEVKRPAPLAIAAIRETLISCEPRKIEEVIRISVSGGVAPYDIVWTGGEVSPNKLQMNTLVSGLYTVTVTDGNGCQQRETFNIISSDVLVDMDINSLAFELNQAFLVNMDVTFINQSVGPISSYYWDFGDGTISFDENPTHRYQAEGEYTVTFIVTDIYGCTQEIKRILKVFDYFLVMPNIFTPNGDGVNDHYFPKFINISSLEFWVLNKWGETIFFTNDSNGPGWDGTVNGDPAMPGNYVYRLKYVTIDGRVFNKTDVFMLLK